MLSVHLIFNRGFFVQHGQISLLLSSGINNGVLFVIGMYNSMVDVEHHFTVSEVFFLLKIS